MTPLRHPRWVIRAISSALCHSRYVIPAPLASDSEQAGTGRDPCASMHAVAHGTGAERRPRGWSCSTTIAAWAGPYMGPGLRRDDVCRGDDATPGRHSGAGRNPGHHAARSAADAWCGRRRCASLA